MEHACGQQPPSLNQLSQKSKRHYRCHSAETCRVSIGDGDDGDDDDVEKDDDDEYDVVDDDLG